MLITIYKKLPTEQLYLIRFELVNNKYRKLRGEEGQVLRAGQWREFEGNSYQTGKARASLTMFKEMNRFIERGYSIYKKKSKKIKSVKPIIRIRQFNLNAVKKLYDEGNDLYFSCYSGILAVMKPNGYIYNNQTKRKIVDIYSNPAPKIQLLGYFVRFKGEAIKCEFTPFIWKTWGSPKELEMWIDFSKQKNLKILVKVGEFYYG